MPRVPRDGGSRQRKSKSRAARVLYPHVRTVCRVRVGCLYGCVSVSRVHRSYYCLLRVSWPSPQPPSHTVAGLLQPARTPGPLRARRCARVSRSLLRVFGPTSDPGRVAGDRRISPDNRKIDGRSCAVCVLCVCAAHRARAGRTAGVGDGNGDGDGDGGRFFCWGGGGAHCCCILSMGQRAGCGLRFSAPWFYHRRHHAASQDHLRHHVGPPQQAPCDLRGRQTFVHVLSPKFKTRPKLQDRRGCGDVPGTSVLLPCSVERLEPVPLPLPALRRWWWTRRGCS